MQARRRGAPIRSLIGQERQVATTRKTGFVFEELYLWHDTQNWPSAFPPGLTLQPGEHAENPETKRRIKNLLDVSGLTDQLTRLRPEAADEATLKLFHTEAHVAHIKRLSAAYGGEAGETTPMGRGSYEIAALGVGGTIRAVDAVLAGEVENAYALTRPPGHHAEPDQARGFCLFGNIAIAVKKAQAQKRVGRVAIVDWDVHHGNGTQAAFYDDPSVLTISLHQETYYPEDSGGIEENGTGSGAGYALNLPLPPGCGDDAYLAAIDRLVLPALTRFRPDLILVACGFDACAIDPLGRMMVTSEGFRAMTARMMAAADDLTHGRIVFGHEGGYSAMYAPYCALAVFETLSGRMTGVEDPWLSSMRLWGGRALQPHQEAAIARALPLLDRI